MPNGAAAHASQRVTHKAAGEDMDCSATKGNNPRDSTKRAASYPHTSPSQRGRVSKKHLTYHQPADDDADDDTDLEQEQSVTLAALPTTDNPVSEKMLKDMFLSLQKDLRKDINKSISRMQS